MNKKLEEDNQKLKKQMEEEMSKYSNIEDTINDIKRREAQLRDRYESELQNQRDKVKMLTQEMNDNKESYDRLKAKLQEKNKQLRE